MILWKKCAFLVSEELIVKQSRFAVFLRLRNCWQLARKNYRRRTLKGEVRVFFFALRLQITTIIIILKYLFQDYENLHQINYSLNTFEIKVLKLIILSVEVISASVQPSWDYIGNLGS